MMKNVRCIAAALLAAVLSSCLDTEEKFVLNADNSGTYSLTIDLGRMLKMAGSMGGDESNPDKTREMKGTTIYLKDFINTADNLTGAEKVLYKDGLIHVNVDEANNEMKIVMSSPFKNTAGLTEIKNNFSKVLDKLKAFEKASGEKEIADAEGNEMKMGAKSANPVGDQFTFVAGQGKISNTINNIDGFKTLAATDSTLTKMEQMTSMMGDFSYRTIFILPKAVKKYEGPGSTVSVDKKTVTFFTTLAEIMEYPEKVSYKVEY